MCARAAGPARKIVSALCRDDQFLLPILRTPRRVLARRAILVPATDNGDNGSHVHRYPRVVHAADGRVRTRDYDCYADVGTPHTSLL
jgi:hypothetical protein